MTAVICPIAAALLTTLAMLVGAADAAWAQAPPTRDVTGRQPPAPVGTAEISGFVMMSGGTQPARKTRVSLSGAELRGGRSAITDDSGRYMFTALPAGRYNLSASRPGFLSATYGQRQPGRPGTQIQLADGQKFRADLQIPKGSVITGTVLDEHGEPAPQTSVRVMRVVTTNGERTLQGGNSATTDDRGVYRIFGLMPGEYVVCATPRNTVVPDFQRMEIELRSLQEAATQVPAEQAQQLRERITAIQGSMPPPGDETPSGYAPICYPSAVAATGASAVPLGIAEERTAIDLQLQLAPLANVEGTVLNSTGAPLTQMNVTLSSNTMQGPSMLSMNARPDAEGRFRISNVPPGQYRITARSTIAPPRTPQAPAAVGGRGRGTAPAPRPQPITVWASADISVDGRNVSNVVLSLQHGVTVSGQLAFEGTATPPADLTRMRVNVMPVGSNPFGGAGTGQVDAAGRFSVQGVPPGRYRLTASGAAGFTPESAMINGQDALDFPFEVKGSQAIGGVTITLTDRRTELTGTVVDDKNQPAVDYTIVVFPADSRYWGSATRRIQTTRPGTDGKFTFRNLPPGEYRIATPVDIEPGSATNPEVLQQLEGASMRVTLQAGETKIQNIRLGGG